MGEFLIGLNFGPYGRWKHLVQTGKLVPEAFLAGIHWIFDRRRCLYERISRSR